MKGIEKGASSPPHTLKEGGCGIQPQVGCGRPLSNTLAAAEGRDRGRGSARGSRVSGRTLNS